MTLTFDLVTPEKLLLSEAVEMVVVPGAEGDFGVLENHSPLVSAIRPGVIEVQKDAGKAQRIFVSGGFAEVTNARCTVLATEAVDLATVTKKDAESRLEKARAALAKAKTDAESAKAAVAVEAAETLLAAV